jgi:hypothetical protein
MLICIGREINVLQCKLLERVLNYTFMNKLVNYEGIRNGEDLFGWSYDSYFVMLSKITNKQKKIKLRSYQK